MAEFGDVSAIEVRDSRFLVIESSLQELQDGMRIWGDIVREGFADLSMQMKAITQESRLVQKRNLEAAMESDVAVSGRLAEIEQRTQAMQTKLQEDTGIAACHFKTERQLEIEQRMQAMQTKLQENTSIAARRSKTERQRRELQSTIEKMQFQHLPEEQRSRDQLVEYIHEIVKTCLQLDTHLESSREGLPLLNRDEQQQLQAHKSPQPQSQARQISQTDGTLWLQQQRDHNKQHDAACPLVERQERAANHVLQHSRDAKCMPNVLTMASGISAGPDMMNRTCPGQRHDVTRDGDARMSSARVRNVRTPFVRYLYQCPRV